MKRFIVPVALSATILGMASQPLAQGRGSGPKTKATGTSAHGGGAANQGGGAATHGGAAKQGATTHGAAATQGGKVQHDPTSKTTHASSHTKTTSDSPKTAKSTKSTGTSTTTTATSTTTTATTTTAGETTQLSAVQQKLQRNTNLAEKLQTRLPKGTDVIAAAADFRNLGQYVAAVNVSNNLKLDFATLKTAMVDDGLSLGQAIQAQRSSLDGTTEARRAQLNADALIASTETTKTKTPATTSATKDRK